MKLQYRCAVVSFCTDLTQGDATSVPIAGVLVGEVPGKGLVAGVLDLVLAPEIYKNDPIAAIVLRDLSKLLREQVDAAWGAHAAERPSPDVILHSIQNALRNSIHISKISDGYEKELDAQVYQEQEPALKFVTEELVRHVVGAITNTPPASVKVDSNPEHFAGGMHTATAPSSSPKQIASKADNVQGVQAWRLRPEHSSHASA